MRVGTLANTAAMAVAFGTIASADDIWEVRGDWAIKITDLGSCYAARDLEDGSHVRFGTDPKQGGGFFAIYNRAWTNVEEGEIGSIVFDFEDMRFGGDVKGAFLGDAPGGYVFFDNPAFADAFAAKQFVSILGEAGDEFELDLTGTHNAMNGVFSCQEAGRANRQAPD